MHEDPSLIYQLPINPTEFTEFFKTLPKSEFSYDHSFENKSSYSLLTGNELLVASRNFEDNKSINIFNYFIMGINDRWYLLLTSSKFVIQTVDIKGDVLYITGEKRLYSKPYIIGLEFEQDGRIAQIYVNDELKYDSEAGVFDLDE